MESKKTFEECIAEMTTARERWVNACALANCARVLGATKEVCAALDAEVKKRFDEEGMTTDAFVANGHGGRMRRLGPYTKPPERLVKVLVAMGGGDKATVTIDHNGEMGGGVRTETFVAEAPADGLWRFQWAVDPAHAAEKAKES